MRYTNKQNRRLKLQSKPNHTWKQRRAKLDEPLTKSSATMTPSLPTKSLEHLIFGLKLFFFARQFRISGSIEQPPLNYLKRNETIQRCQGVVLVSCHYNAAGLFILLLKATNTKQWSLKNKLIKLFVRSSFLFCSIPQIPSSFQFFSLCHFINNKKKVALSFAILWLSATVPKQQKSKTVRSFFHCHKLHGSETKASSLTINNILHNNWINKRTKK